MMRDMTADDVDAVLAVEQSVQAYPWTRGHFVDALASGYVCRVDEAEGGIRSYAVLMPAVEEAELLTIGVAANCQRRGLGRAMLQEMFRIARDRNMRCVFLEVRQSNLAALALYLGSGFIKVGLRRDYYRNANGSEDAVTMACELKESGHGQA